MADDGLIFSTDDSDFTSKMNRKSIVIGRGRQLNSLINTYPGQYAYCTETENGFTIDNYYRRNSANSAWNSHLAGVESAEVNSGFVSDSIDVAGLSTLRAYRFFTLPTTEKLYIFTKIEWKNGATISGNITCGIDIVIGIPPTLNRTYLVGVTAEVAQSGASSLQSSSLINSIAVRGGTEIGVWFSCSSATGTIRGDSLGSGNVYKSTSYSISPLSIDHNVFSASTTRTYLNAYYRGLL